MEEINSLKIDLTPQYPSVDDDTLYDIVNNILTGSNSIKASELELRIIKELANRQSNVVGLNQIAELDIMVKSAPAMSNLYKK